MINSSPIGNNRDRRRLTPPSSHTTGHAGPHPAVRSSDGDMLLLRVEPFLAPFALTATCTCSVSFRPSAFSLRSLWFLSTQMSAAVAFPRLSVQLLVRSALRPVDSFHYPPWVVATPPTTTASADFCPGKTDLPG